MERNLPSRLSTPEQAPSPPLSLFIHVGDSDRLHGLATLFVDLLIEHLPIFSG